MTTNILKHTISRNITLTLIWAVLSRTLTMSCMAVFRIGCLKYIFILSMVLTNDVAIAHALLSELSASPDCLAMAKDSHCYYCYY